MIGIIGSGNVGANTAFFLAEKGVDHVTLFDIQEGMAKGKALDMMEAAPIRRYGTKIRGTDSFDEVKSADIVITTNSLQVPAANTSHTRFGCPRAKTTVAHAIAAVLHAWKTCCQKSAARAFVGSSFSASSFAVQRPPAPQARLSSPMLFCTFAG